MRMNSCRISHTKGARAKSLSKNENTLNIISAAKKKDLVWNDWIGMKQERFFSAYFDTPSTEKCGI